MKSKNQKKKEMIRAFSSDLAKVCDQSIYIEQSASFLSLFFEFSLHTQFFSYLGLSLFLALVVNYSPLIMKPFSIFLTLFVSTASGLDHSNNRFFDKRQYFANTTHVSSKPGSTVYQVYKPTSTITKINFLTVTAQIPTEVVTVTPVLSTRLITSAIPTTFPNGATSKVTYTLTSKIVQSSEVTVTRTITKTIVAPSDDVQGLINSVLEAGGVASVGSTVVSLNEKVITVTQPIYATITPAVTGTAEPTPQVITLSEIDTITITQQITKIVVLPTTELPLFRNVSVPLISTQLVESTQTILTTIDYPAISTVTNTITITNSAGVEETKVAVAEFTYNFQKTSTLTPVTTITKTITLTTTAVVEPKATTVLHTYCYQVTHINQDGQESVVQRTAVDAETSSWTVTKTITVPASTSTTYVTLKIIRTVSNSVYTSDRVIESFVVPTFVTISPTSSGRWNSSNTAILEKRHHAHQRHALRNLRMVHFS